MKAVILAGGRGTRLGTLSDDCPKPLIPVGGSPVLFHQLELLAHSGIQEVWLLTGYRGAMIQHACGTGERWGLNMHYLQEESLQGTAGALRALQGVIQEDFLLFSGDIMMNFDIPRFITWHRSKPQAKASVVVHPNGHMLDSDLVELDSTDRVIALHLRPHPPEQWFHNQSVASAYLFSPEVLPYIPAGKCDIEKALFPTLLQAGLALYGYSTPEYLKDMGTPDRLARVEQDFIAGRIQQMSLELPKKAVFLDRDGVINHYLPDLHRSEDFQLYEGVAQAVRALNHAGWLVIVVTNQPALAKGLLSEAGLDEIHRRMETELGREGAILDAIYYCPHHPDRGFAGEVPELKRVCTCRKPAIGMIEAAARRFHLDLQHSWLIGDSCRDWQTASRAGLQFIGVRTGLGCRDMPADAGAIRMQENLYQAVEQILSSIS